MTEPMANVGLDQEMLELPENIESEAKVEGGDLQNLSVEKSSQMPTVADLTGISECVKIFAEDKLAGKSDNAEGKPLELQTDNAPSPVAVDLSGNCDSIKVSVEDKLAEKSDKADDAPLQGQTNDQVVFLVTEMETGSDQRGAPDVKAGKENEAVAKPMENKTSSVEMDVKEGHLEDNHTKTPLMILEKTGGEHSTPVEGSNHSFIFESYMDGEDSGTEEEQVAFVRELENFYRERNMEFKPPKFYGEALNCLKLWRTVTRFGGYDQVTVSKLWRQVGECFNPPKTCTTVSWSFRIFYEKALLEYEKHKIQTGELKFSMVNLSGSVNVDNQVGGNQASSSGRARRDAAARAMQGWHAQRLLESGDVGDPIIKDKNSPFFLKSDKQLKSFGTLKKRKASNLEHAVKVAKTDSVKPQGDITVIDIGAPADWVKINVLKTKDCFEVYALVPGLLREEVQVQSDPAGRLIISGEPEQPDNPWGVTPFKKIITLPARIDPHQTSAVVTLHGQLLVRAPLEVPVE